MPTRATAITRTVALDPWYKLQSTDQFPVEVLPTKPAVLQRLLHEKTGKTKIQSKLFKKKIFKIWNAYQISQKVFDLANAFKIIERYPSSKKGAAFLKKGGGLYQ